MLAEIIGEVVGAFNWVLSQLGWDIGSLSWVHIVLLVLAAVGILVVTRNLIGGHSGSGGGGSTAAYYPQNREPRGLPTSYYTGSSRLGDFSIPQRVYDFRVPSPTPNLAELRKSVKLDMEKAGQLFIMPNRPKTVPPVEDLQARSTDCQAFSDKGQSAPKPAGPDWEKARELFIPRIRR